MNVPALPDYLKNKPYESVSDQLSGSLGTGSPPYLSIMGGRFTLVDSAGNEFPINTVANGIPYIDVVIIDSLERQSKIFYGADRAFDPTNFAPPKCFSDNGIGPSRGASQPQSPTCASCEKGAWGSAVSKVDPNKKTKACADYQKLALMVPGHDGIYLLRTPPNSLRPLREYTARFRGTGTDVSDIITRITFEKDVLGTLVFSGVSYIDQAAALKRNEIRQKALTDAIVGRLDQPVTAVAGHLQPSIQSLTTAMVPVAQPEGFQSGPFGGASPVVSGAPTVATGPTSTVSLSPPGSVATNAGPSPSSGRRGRPKKNTNGPEIAPPAQQELSPPFPTNPGQFGIAQGQAPDKALSETLTNFFGASK